MKPFALIPIAFSLLMLSCQSDTDKANEVINTALKMNEAAGQGTPASDTAQLAIQTASYTSPVKQVPTQEELIKKYRVKSVKQTYAGGWNITNYDKNGNKVSEENDYSGKKTYTCKFDANGNKVYEKTKYKSGSIFSLEYEYNSKGKPIKKSFTDNDGKTTITTINYDSLRNTKTEVAETGKDKEFYDTRGLRVRFESYDEKGKMMGYGEATYDEDGLKKSEKAVIMGLNAYDEYEYNERGQLIKQHRTGMLDVIFLFEYDEKGLMISSKTIKGISEDETVYSYTYY